MIVRDLELETKGYSAKRRNNIVNLIMNSCLSLEQISRAYQIPMDELARYADELNDVRA